MKRYLMIALLVLSVMASGVVIKTQRSDIQDLNARIEDIQQDQLAERAHLNRELERQQRLNNLEYTLGKQYDEAENDHSDADAFGKSRVMRLNQIR